MTLIAIYHFDLKINSRGKGKSAVASAAYRVGELITNEYDGVEHDYRRKSGVVHTEIILPVNAPAEYADRATLWNAVEKVEKQCNSQLAREINVALPVELSFEQNLSLLRRYVQDNFVAVGDDVKHRLNKNLKFCDLHKQIQPNALFACANCRTQNGDDTFYRRRSFCELLTLEA